MASKLVTKHYTLDFLLAYGLAAAAFCALDFLWLGFLSGSLYRDQLGVLLLAEPRLGAAAIFYVLYLAGLVWFCVMPALATGARGRAAFNGAFFGLVAYATYDLTNLATLRAWSPTLAAIDLAWGAFVTGVSAGVSCCLTHPLRRLV